MAIGAKNSYSAKRTKAEKRQKRLSFRNRKRQSNGASQKVKPVSATSRLRVVFSFSKFLYRTGVVGVCAVIALYVYDKRIVVNDFVNPTVSGVAVAGELKNVDRKELRVLLEGLVNQRYFELDIEHMSENIRNIPWVADVQIRKKWPEQVQVIVSEKTPIARWGTSGLVDNQGEIFYVDSTDSEFIHLPLLQGPDSESSVLIDKFLLIVKRFESKSIVIEQVSLSATGSWSMRIAGGPKVILGKSQFDKRLNRLFTLWDTIENQRLATIGAMDFRYSNGVAVSEWKDQTNDYGVRR
mgnify:CR=1 FL=1